LKSIKEFTWMEEFYMYYIRIIKKFLTVTIFLAILPACMIFSSNVQPSYGGIYGQLKIKVDDNYLSPKIATIYLSRTNIFTSPNAEGVFYFDNILPGEYSVIAKAPGFADMILEKVEVDADSISIVDMRSLTKQILQTIPSKRPWHGQKIKKININQKGNVAGKVFIDRLDLYRYPNIYIEGTPWEAQSDSSGRYQIHNVIPGLYTIKLSIPYYHTVKIYDVKIRHDLTSIVNFKRLLPEIYPENIAPIKWVEEYNK
jgi:hypothetical protein